MKVKISPFTWFLLLVALWMGWLVPLLHIFLMMTLHECGHGIAALCFSYPIRQVEVYPFGLAITLEEFGNRNAWQELIILAAGLAVHGIIPFLYQQAVLCNLVSEAMMQWLMQINLSVFLFNSLPLYPLDGGRIVQSVLHCIFPYQTSERLISIFSLFIMPYLFYKVVVFSIFPLAVFLFIFYLNWDHLRHLPYQTLSFYWFRLTHPVILPCKIHQQDDLYRQRSNIILVKGIPVLEKDWLSLRIQRTQTNSKRKLSNRMF